MRKGKQKCTADSNSEHTVAQQATIKADQVGADAYAASCSLDPDTLCNP